MTGSKFDALPEYAFPRLRALLDSHAPGGDPIAMSIGEPRHGVPDLLMEVLSRHAAEFSKYPPIDGTEGWRAAVGDWHGRRYGLTNRAFDPHTQLLPLNGTREGLFMAAIALAPARKNDAQAAVLLPNPFYQCYAAAAIAAGAEPVYVPATAETGWMPDFAALPDELLERTGFAYFCTPSNPQGAVASQEAMATVMSLAESYGFTVAFDECYSEIYRETPPVGAIEVALAEGIDLNRILAFNSLSKRSNVPGLRSGFVASGADSILAMKRLRAYAGAPNPLPALHAAEALWQDETHVIASRALYREKLQLADDILGGLPGYISPEAGFFLWLHVGDGEASAVQLWREHGVRTLPGAYLARSDPRFLGGANPGAAFLRAALVEPVERIRPGLKAIAALLRDTQDRESGT